MLIWIQYDGCRRHEQYKRFQVARSEQIRSNSYWVLQLKIQYGVDGIVDGVLYGTLVQIGSNSFWIMESILVMIAEPKTYL